MPAEFEFHARLFSSLKDYISKNESEFNEPIGEEKTKTGFIDIFLPSDLREGVVIEVKRGDIDPHSYEVVKQGHRYARDKGVSLFATANENDVFLFRRTETATSITELDRNHYDLRRLSLQQFFEQFLEDIKELQEGRGQVYQFDDLIISRLRSFHTSIFPTYQELIKRGFNKNERFQEQLIEWARENDYPFEYPGVERTFKIAAQQYAYLLMNRVVFYELVREQKVDTESGLPLNQIYGGVAVDKLDQHLEDCFQSIMEEIDYEAIFKNESDFFEQIPENDLTRKRLHSFTQSIEEEPLRDISVDVAGQIYQELIPVEERKELGQFYTPDEIGSILSNWAIQSSDDRFLDPCSGSGSITVEAYKRIEELNGLSHEEIIRNITAVDINKFPLHLTALNLATRNIYQPTNELFAYHADFFDLDPDTKRLQSSRLGVRGEGVEGSNDPIGKFDATAANPPYVRQEYLYPNRDHFREHLKQFGPSSKQVYYDGKKEIDGRSDLYCYFLTHVTSFLREGGRLAWIVPTKWMVADYGPSLQQFLFDHYKIEAVVGFRKRVFKSALVDTVLLMMESCEDLEERKDTETNFVRINSPIDPDDALRVIDRDYGIPDDSFMKIHSRPNYRTISVEQSYLMENIEEKLHHYINAPALYTAVLEHIDTVPLSDVATITRGKKTGANPIFILDEDEIRSRNVEEEFLKPAIKSVKEVDGFEHTANDAEKWMLDMNDYVNDVMSMSGFGSMSNLEDRVLQSLRTDGYDGVLSYLQWAENQSSRTNKSIQNHEPWFNMGPLEDDLAPIICPQAMDTRRFFFKTDQNIVPSNRFLLVKPHGDPELLLGLLNSSINKIVIESHGRVTGGGAINLSGSDLRSLRVLNPDSLSDEQASKVKTGFEKLTNRNEEGLADIDEVFIDVLDLDVTMKEIQRMAETIKQARRTKGQEVEPLIQELDKLEGQIEMAFKDNSPQQQGLSEFSG